MKRYDSIEGVAGLPDIGVCPKKTVISALVLSSAGT
jgi:hypothetical protein